MTGTALTEEKEFRNTYGMDAVAIPTNKPVIRVDHEDAVYKTKRGEVQGGGGGGRRPPTRRVSRCWWAPSPSRPRSCSAGC